jgi:transcriptional regulator with XRE-family HTH domain
VKSSHIDHLILKRLRKQLALSLSGLAQLLGLSGDNAADMVREMENGTRPISGPIARLCRYINQGVLGDEAVYPTFLICDGLEAAADSEIDSPGIIFHTRYPRFLAWVVPSQDIEPEMIHIAIDAVGSLAVGVWIDDPLPNGEDKTMALLQEAADLFDDYNERLG